MTAGLAQGIDRTGVHPVRSIGRVDGAVATTAIATMRPVSPLMESASTARAAQASRPASASSQRPIELHYHAAPGDKDPQGGSRMHQQLKRLMDAERSMP